MATTSRGANVGALAPATASLSRYSASPVDHRHVSTFGRQKADARALCAHGLRDDRGSGGALARSQRAPSRSRAPERVPDQAWVPSREARRALAARLVPRRQHDGQVSGEQKSERCTRRSGASRSGWDGVTRTPRGRGRRLRAVSRSLAGEDHTRTPRGRARTRSRTRAQSDAWIGACMEGLFGRGTHAAFVSELDEGRRLPRPPSSQTSQKRHD